MKLSSSLAAIALSASLPAFAQSYNPGQRYDAPGAGTVGFEAARKRGPCGDPWVTMAQEVVYGRATPERCDPKLYNGGRWDSYNTLVHAMAKAKGGGGGGVAAPAYPTVDLSLVKYRKDGANWQLFTKDGLQIATMVAAGGGNITVSLPPQMVAAGGGNVIGQNNANMVAAGGGNLANVIKSELGKNPPVAPMAGYSLQGVARLNDLKGK